LSSFEVLLFDVFHPNSVTRILWRFVANFKGRGIEIDVARFGCDLIAAMPNQQLYLPGKAEIPVEM
jgi:hypothetical protein